MAVRDGFALGATRDDQAAGGPARSGRRKRTAPCSRAPSLRARLCLVRDGLLDEDVAAGGTTGGGERGALGLVPLFRVPAATCATTTIIFYWSMDTLCRIVEFYGREGSRRAGRLSNEAEGAALEMMWLWAKENSALSERRVARIKDVASHALREPPSARFYHGLAFCQAADARRSLLRAEIRPTEPRPAPNTTRRGPNTRASTCWSGHARACLWKSPTTDTTLSRSRALQSVRLRHPTPSSSAAPGCFWISTGRHGPRNSWEACAAAARLGFYPTIFSTIGLSGNIARLAWFYFGLGHATPPQRIRLHDAVQRLAAAARGDRPRLGPCRARPVRDSPVAAGPGRARL